MFGVLMKSKIDSMSIFSSSCTQLKSRIIIRSSSDLFSKVSRQILKMLTKVKILENRLVFKLKKKWSRINYIEFVRLSYDLGRFMKSKIDIMSIFISS